MENCERPENAGAAHKLEVDILVLGGTVLTLDDADSRLYPGAVAVHAGKIEAVGPSEDLQSRFAARKVINATGCVVMPGLINAHTHAAMTIFRGLADDLPLMQWLQEHIFPAERKLTGDWVYHGTLLACAEMILSGTTTFCDMYLFEHKTAEAAEKAGIRTLVGEVLYDFPSPNYGPAENALPFTERLAERWKSHPLVRVAVEPHALYTCSPGLLRGCGELAERLDIPIIVHLSENQAEVKEIEEKYGRRPVEHLEYLGLLSPRLIADHCVALNGRDMELLAQRGVHAVHNPESNMKLASGIAPVPLMLDMGINVALGTDGCASNNDLDMLSEMDTCAKLHKVATLDPTVLPALTVLKMATRNGAAALGMEGRVGVLARGMLADLIVLDFQKPHLTPLYEPASHLVYAARGSDVRDSIIHGRLVMENRRLTTLDLGEVMDNVRRIAKDVRP